MHEKVDKIPTPEDKNEQLKKAIDKIWQIQFWPTDWAENKDKDEDQRKTKQ